MSDEHTDPRPAADDAPGPVPGADEGAGPAPGSAAAAAAAYARHAPSASPTAAQPRQDDDDDAAADDVVVVDAEVIDAEMDADALQTALSEAVRQRDEYLDQAQRNRAEYLNLKRRSEEQLAAALDRGAERLLAQLLGVLDNLGYVVDAATRETEDAGDSSLGKGVSMVSGELFGVLGAAGLEPVPGEGAPFDPQVHEALLSEEAEEPLDEPVVTEVLRRGWQFKGRVLRPASVKVAR